MTCLLILLNFGLQLDSILEIRPFFDSTCFPAQTGQCRQPRGCCVGSGTRPVAVAKGVAFILFL